MSLNKEKIFEIYKNFSDFMEKMGVKLTKGLFIYSIILCVICVNLDRCYIEWKLKRAVNSAFEEAGKIFSGDSEKPKKDKTKKKKFFAPKPQNISIGDILTKDNSYEMNFKKKDFVTELKPPKIRDWSIYNYYKPKDNDNLYINTIIDIKNLETSEIDAKDLIQSIKAIYDKKYEYEGFVAMELADGSDFEESSYKIKPLQTRKIHILVEVPKVAKSDDKPVDLTFDILDKTYILNIKADAENENNVSIKHSEQQKQETQIIKQEQTTKNMPQQNKPQVTKPQTQTIKKTASKKQSKTIIMDEPEVVHDIKTKHYNTQLTPSINHKSKSTLEQAHDTLFD